MLKKLLPAVLSVAAFLGGAAGGEMLRRGPPADAAPAAEPGPAVGNAPAGTAGQAAPEAAAPDPTADHATAAAPVSADHAQDAGGHGQGDDGAAAGTAWFKFPQQFFVPILYDGRLDSTMILTLSAEMPAAAQATVHAHEIKLRDALLRQLLIHANTGGFDGNFTREAQLRKLREILTATAREVVPEIAAILIGDIARQER